MSALLRIGVPVTATIAAIAIFSLTPWPASGYRHTDFFQFYAAPAALLEGRSPYDHDWYVEFARRIGSRALDFWTPGWASPYPAWTDVATLPLPLLPLPIAAASWLVIQIAAVGWTLVALGARLFGSARARSALILGGIAIAFEPLWGLIGGGNVSGLVAAGLAGAVAASLAGHALIAGALLGLVALKPQLAVVIVPLFLLVTPATQRLRLLAGAAILLGALALVGIALRPAWPREWLDLLARGLPAESNASAWTLDQVVPGGPLVPVALAVAAGALFLTWWVRAGPDFPMAMAAAVALGLFLAPHARHYDQILLLVTAAALVARMSELGPFLRVPAVAATSVVFAFVPWLLYVVAAGRGVVREVVDLHEEWNAVLPLLVFLLVVVIDRLAAWRRPPAMANGG